MNRKIIVLIIVFLMITSGIAASDQTIRLLVPKDYDINQNVFIAQIEPLKEKSKVLLVGNSLIEKFNQDHRLRLNWHSLSLDEGEVIPISSPLASRVVIRGSNKIQSGETFLAQGDVYQLLVEVGRLSSGKKLSSISRKQAERNNELKNVSEISKHRISNRPDQNFSSIGYDEDYKRNEEKKELIPDLTSHSSKEACAPRFDFESAQKFPRHRIIKKTADGKLLGKESCTDTGEIIALEVEQIECDRLRLDGNMIQLYYRRHVYGEEGEVIHTGECVDIDEPVDIQQDYNAGCDDFYDIDSKKLYKRFTEYFIKDEERIDLEHRGCEKGGLETAVDLTPTQDGCEVRDDFDNKISIQQIRWYALTQEGHRDYITSCIDTDDPKLIFDHYLTTDGCTNVRKDGSVILYQQSAYNRNGSVHLTHTCAPKIGGRRDVHEEACPEEYIHDFRNGYSKRYVRHYFIASGEKNYLGSCQQEPKNYPHSMEYSGCPVEIDRTSHKKFRLSKITFENKVGTIKLIDKNCSRREQGIPYTTSISSIDSGFSANNTNKQIRQFPNLRISADELENGTGTPVTFKINGSATFMANRDNDLWWTGNSYYQVMIYIRVRGKTRNTGWQPIITLANPGSQEDAAQTSSFNTKASRTLNPGDIVEFAAMYNHKSPWSARINVKTEWD